MKPPVALRIMDCSECVPCNNLFSTVLVSIEQVGSCHRLTFGSPDGIDEGPGRVLHRRVGKVVLTDEALQTLHMTIPHYYAQLHGAVNRRHQPASLALN
jgi:hypothetical protein